MVTQVTARVNANQFVLVERTVWQVSEAELAIQKTLFQGGLFLIAIQNVTVCVCVCVCVCVPTFSTCCCSWFWAVVLAGWSWTTFLGVPISSSASASRNTLSSKSPTVNTYSSYSLFMALLDTHTHTYRYQTVKIFEFIDIDGDRVEKSFSFWPLISDGLTCYQWSSADPTVLSDAHRCLSGSDLEGKFRTNMSHISQMDNGHLLLKTN